MRHFDEMTCLLYLDGQLDAERARELAAHASECAECRELLQALESEGRWLRAALVEEEEAVPARLLEPPSRAQAPWGWIAALGFGSAGAYTLWNGIIEPWRLQFSQAGFNGGSLLTILFFSGAFWKGWETMPSLLGFLAMFTLGILLLVLIRRTWRRWTIVAAVLSLLLCATAVSPVASAAEIKKGNPNYTLPAGEEVKRDLIVAANWVRIDGTVDGDLIAGANEVTMDGHVTGDVLTFVGKLRIHGRVDGNVRTFSQSLSLDGIVGKNVAAWCREIEISPKSRVGGSLTAFAEDVEINGRLERDLLAFVGNTELNGFLGGDVTLRGGRLNIDSNADIRGSTKFKGAQRPSVSPSAKLASPIEFTLRTHLPKYATVRYYWHQALFWGAGFFFGLVLLLVSPGFFSDVVRSSRRYGPSFGFGFLALIAAPVAAVIACATLVGLGVGLATLFLYLIALYASQVFVGAWVGEKLLGEGVGTGAAIGRLALGLLVIRVFISLPHVGGLIMFLVILWGLGALVLALSKRMRPETAAA